MVTRVWYARQQQCITAALQSPPGAQGYCPVGACPVNSARPKFAVQIWASRSRHAVCRIDTCEHLSTCSSRADADPVVVTSLPFRLQQLKQQQRNHAAAKRRAAREACVNFTEHVLCGSVCAECRQAGAAHSRRLWSHPPPLQFPVVPVAWPPQCQEEQAEPEVGWAGQAPQVTRRYAARCRAVPGPGSQQAGKRERTWHHRR